LCITRVSLLVFLTKFFGRELRQLRERTRIKKTHACPFRVIGVIRGYYFGCGGAALCFLCFLWLCDSACVTISSCTLGVVVDRVQSMWLNPRLCVTGRSSNMWSLPRRKKWQKNKRITSRLRNRPSR